MSASARFLFTTCQLGAEPALKAEMARLWPDARFAFSRPGFLTFKLPEGHPLAENLELRSVFARAASYSLGKVTGDDPARLAEQFWQAVGELPYSALHVWQRDTALPGERDFQPGVTPLAEAAEHAIHAAAPDPVWRSAPPASHRTASRGQWVLDCVLVEPTQWWFGTHRADALPTRYPGGVIPLKTSPTAVSRAYLKMQEALRWSRLPVQSGDRVVELGSAPGGASQALLERGLHVTGVDPAEMALEVLADPNFHHVRMRGADLKRRAYRSFQWLTADMNVAPAYTLDTVESIVTHRDVHLRGLLLTLKLLEWKLADEIPEYLARIRSWGFRDVQARQLAHNRQEICVAALRNRGLRRAKQPTGRRRPSTGQEG